MMRCESRQAYRPSLPSQGSLSVGVVSVVVTIPCDRRRASPSYSPNRLATYTLHIVNQHAHAPPRTNLTAFQAVSARRWRLIGQDSTGTLVPPLT